MPQGSQTAGFSMTELMHIALGAIPKPQLEPSLFRSKNPSTIPDSTFYMDDIFATHSKVNRRGQLQNHPLPPQLLPLYPFDSYLPNYVVYIIFGLVLSRYVLPLGPSRRGRIGILQSFDSSHSLTSPSSGLDLIVEAQEESACLLGQHFSVSAFDFIQYPCVRHQ